MKQRHDSALNVTVILTDRFDPGTLSYCNHAKDVGYKFIKKRIMSTQIYGVQITEVPTCLPQKIRCKRDSPQSNRIQNCRCLENLWAMPKRRHSTVTGDCRLIREPCSNGIMLQIKTTQQLTKLQSCLTSSFQNKPEKMEGLQDGTQAIMQQILYNPKS